MKEYMELTVEEQLAYLGLTIKDCTKYTYIYVLEDGVLRHCEKRDSHSYFIGEQVGYYVRSAYEIFES